MTNSIRDLTQESRCIFIIGSNTSENHPVIGTKIRRAKRLRGVKLIVADPRHIDIAEHADLFLRNRPGTDIALLNGIMHVIVREGWHDESFIAERTEGFEELKAILEKYTPEVTSEITGVPAADIELAARMMAENRPGALVYAMGITQHKVGVANVMSCANLQMLLGNMGKPGGGVNPLRGQNNVQGACDMGALPNVYSGYQQVTQPATQEKFEAAWGVPLSGKAGLTVTEMIQAAEEGRVRCLYIVGENPMVSDPDLRHVQFSLQKTEFIIVQELFFSETCHYADVILPAASFAEKEGTFTNTERRIQRVRKAVDAPGEAKTDLWIAAELARRLLALGVAAPRDDAPFAAWDYSSPTDVMAEINALDAQLCRRHLSAAGQRSSVAVARSEQRPSWDAHPPHRKVHPRAGPLRCGRSRTAGRAPQRRISDGHDHRPGALPLARRRDDTARAGIAGCLPGGAGGSKRRGRSAAGHRRRRPGSSRLAPRRGRGQGMGHRPRLPRPGLCHLPLPRPIRQLAHHRRVYGPGGQDPGVQGNGGAAGGSGQSDEETDRSIQTVVSRFV